MESDFTISRNVNVRLVERFVVTERSVGPKSNIQGGNVWKFFGIPESVSDDVLEDKIQGILCGIDVEIDTENIEFCFRLKRKVILKT